jgi:hypothetical protein
MESQGGDQIWLMVEHASFKITFLLSYSLQYGIKLCDVFVYIDSIRHGLWV